MLNMQTFHEFLSSVSEKKDSYFDALSAITRISPEKVAILGAGLDWEPWGGVEAPELTKA